MHRVQFLFAVIGLETFVFTGDGCPGVCCSMSTFFKIIYIRAILAIPSVPPIDPIPSVACLVCHYCTIPCPWPAGEDGTWNTKNNKAETAVVSARC